MTSSSSVFIGVVTVRMGEGLERQGDTSALALIGNLIEREVRKGSCTSSVDTFT
jgi:hypothetical protein